MQRRKKKGKKKKHKGEHGRRWAKEKGEDARDHLAGYKQHKKAVTSFPKLHFLPVQCCFIQKGKPHHEDEQSQFCSNLHSEGLLNTWLWCSSAVRLSPCASSWLRTDSRMTCLQPFIGLFAKSPELTLAAQNINTLLCTHLIKHRLGLLRAMLSRGASPSFAWVPVSYRKVLHECSQGKTNHSLSWVLYR